MKSLPLASLNNRSRIALAVIATLGLLETAYLTIAELSGKAAELCPTDGCQEVLESPYSQIFGLPLTLFGFFAYATVLLVALSPAIMAKIQPKLTKKWEQNSWLWLLAITTCMAVSSSYLMYIMFFKIQGICPYCVFSALCSLSLLMITIFGHRWPNWRQLSLIAVIAGVITLTGVLSVYANVEYVADNPATTKQQGELGPPVTNESKEAEIALANHLQKIDAKIYTAFTCPHCYEQKQLFGKEAIKIINDIECHPQGANAQPELCEAAGLKGVPTWEINGELYPGVQPLERLADLSGYTGSRDFTYAFPY